MSSSVGVTGGVIVLMAVLIVLWTVKVLIIIATPNRAAVITGRKRTLAGGRAVGYRTVIGGRTLRIPIIEQVRWVSLETIPLEVRVENAFSKGNIPLSVQAIANVKIASEPETDFNNAVERMLEKNEQEIRGLAQETLTGNLRGVLATLTPEEVNEDRLAFAQNLAEEAENDLKKLGFTLDTLKIQNVSDEVGYLDAIGRKKTAVVKKEAEVAEAQNEAETRQKQAEAKRTAELSEAAAEIAIAEAKNQLRVRQAELNREAETIEGVAKVAARQAEVEAQQQLERQRVETEKQRLEADVVQPAEAERRAAEARAKADAAPILERGKAQVQVLELLYRTIQDGGEQGFAVFLAEKLPELVGITADAVRGIEIDRLVVVDAGDGKGVGNVANQRVGAAFAMLEQLSGSLGVDIEDVLKAALTRRVPVPATGAPGPAPVTVAD